MTPERWALLRSAFHRALECDPGERARLAGELCGGDGSLRAQLEALLEAHDDGDSFLAFPSRRRAAERHGAGAEEPTIPQGAGAGAPRAERVRPGTLLHGRYRIVRALGSGGMSTVFEAVDLRFDRSVAVKASEALTAGVRHAFEREAELLGSLRHPSLPSVGDSFAEADHHFLVMDLVPGDDLSALLARRVKIAGSPFPADRVLFWADQLLDALEYLHSRVPPILHGDVKPQNVRLTPRGEVILLDFGLAKGADPARAPAAPCHGFTPSYAPPEQMLGDDTDARSDVYAVGATAHHLLTGSAPPDAVRRARDAAAGAPDPYEPACEVNPAVPRGVAAVLAAALSLDPGARPRSAAEMRAMLARVGDAAGPDVPGRPEPGRSSADRSAPSGVSRPVRSVAIFPLVNELGEADAEAIGDAIRELLAQRLSRSGEVRVVSGSRFQVPARYLEDPVRAGQALAVEAVVCGRILSSNDRLIAAVEIFGVRDGWRLWGAEYNRSAQSLGLLRGEIERDVAGALGVAAGEGEPPAATSSVPPEAYQLYLKARYYRARRTNEDLARSRAYALRAAEIAPDFAPAHAAAGEASSIQATYSAAPPHEQMLEGRAAAERALSLDPRLAEAHTVLGHVALCYDFDGEAAARHLRRAVELRPTFAPAHHYYGLCLAACGRLAEAVETLKAAQDLEPFTLIISTNLAWVLYFAGRHAEAAAELERTLTLDPTFYRAAWNLTRCHLVRGDMKEAVAAARSARGLADFAGTRALLAYVLARAGETAEALAVREELRRESLCGYVSPFYLAEADTGLGDVESALDNFERAYEERVWLLLWLRYDPFFDSLRREPRFSALLERIGERLRL